MLEKMKTNYFKSWFLAFSLTFILFSCGKDSFEYEVSTTQNRPESRSDIITTDNAKDVAVSFLNISKGDERAEVTKDYIKEVQTIVNDDETPIMYAVNFNDNSGFVVISASFLERPILAYSEKGNFDFETIDEYNGVVDWAYTTYLIINDKIETKEEPDDEVADQWLAFKDQVQTPYQSEYIAPILPGSGGGGGSSSPYPVNSWYEATTKGSLLTTTWNQWLSSFPNATKIGYNNFVRFKNCPQGTSPTGCVAVAMGQIMKYHNHPNIYNINTMPNNVNSGNYTNNEAINIAYFLENIGYNVNMNYNCDSSSASSNKAKNAFLYNYGYDVYYTLVGTKYNLIKQNIDNYLPVYLDGCRNKKVKAIRIRTKIFRFTIKLYETYNDCHAWVTDGYKEIDKFTYYSNKTTTQTKIADLVSCNWGWRGYANGWFYYGSWVRHEYDGDDTDQTHYIYRQRMIHYLKPKNN